MRFASMSIAVGAAAASLVISLLAGSASAAQTPSSLGVEAFVTYSLIPVVGASAGQGADPSAKNVPTDEARAAMLRWGCVQCLGDPDLIEDSDEAQGHGERLADCVAAMARGLRWTDESFEACPEAGISAASLSTCAAAMGTFLLQHDQDSGMVSPTTGSATALMKDVCDPAVLCGG